MFDLINKLKEVQSKMKEAQQSLAKVIVEGEAGAGMVKVKANGLKKIISIHIDDELVKPGDKDMMADLIVAAINKALEEADLAAKEIMKKSAGDFLPNIPGLDLGQFT
ncbi:MAG TPA: YbaB/EbfC family nucleoid-associated protein [Cyclobacteriaceae bacterium]|nr:YbaB/EbfC family nucleoid-associated protein [Cyclobacteriaceae bacterium]